MKTDDSLRTRVAPTGPVDHLSAGNAALGRGDWQAARLAFEAAIQSQEQPEALEGLGLAAQWLDWLIVFDARERAAPASPASRTMGSGRRGWRYGWPGTRQPSAANTRWQTGGSSARTGSSMARPESTEHAWLALRSGVFALLDDGDPQRAQQLAAEAVRIGMHLAPSMTRPPAARASAASPAIMRPAASSRGCRSSTRSTPPRWWRD